VNAGFSALTGYSRDELLDRTLFDLTHPDDARGEHELYARHVRGELKHYAAEKRYVRKDGTASWIAVSASGVFDDNGKFLYSIRIVQDIDQRKRTEERQQLLIRELHHRVRKHPIQRPGDARRNSALSPLNQGVLRFIRGSDCGPG
jgi:PAS domain S-box-containing protein